MYRYYNQESINWTNPRDAAMGGQPGWGRCSNGEMSNVTVMAAKIMFFQPNNWNGGEDCIARAGGAAGYLDNQCNEPYKCLCQWPGATSNDFLDGHGPALDQRANHAFTEQSTQFYQGLGLSLGLGSLPALIYMLVVELWLVRHQQRTAASTPAEARLKIEQRRALRRRMVQSGLALWMGFLLIACSIFPTNLSNKVRYAPWAQSHEALLVVVTRPSLSQRIWPNYGFGTFPYGNPEYWKTLRLPGVSLVMLSILPSDSAAIRCTALLWMVYDVLDAVFLPFFVEATGEWTLEDGMQKDEALGAWGSGVADQHKVDLTTAVIVFRVVVGLVPLRAALFCSCGSGKWRVHPLPSRLALRLIWMCMRISFSLFAFSQVFVYAVWATDKESATAAYRTNMGFPHLITGIINAAFAVFLTAGVRHCKPTSSVASSAHNPEFPCRCAGASKLTLPAAAPPRAAPPPRRSSPL